MHYINPIAIATARLSFQPHSVCIQSGCKIDTEKPFSKQNIVYLDKQDFILDELKSSDVPLPKVITTEFSSSERYVQYMKKCSS